MRIILGLGNPGKEYEKTRHNAGALALHYAARKFKFSEWELAKKYESLAAEGKIGGEKVMFLFPQTFMNNSGKAVRTLYPKPYTLYASRSTLNARNLIVIHDDIDLPLGVFKISFDRGSGGHKGVESVIRALKSQKFARIRVGVSPRVKPEHKKMPDFLTSPFRADELKKLSLVFKKISETLECITADGIERAMNTFN